MARTRKTSKEALEEKIEKAEADVIAAKKKYDQATANLKELLDKRDAIRKEEILSAVVKIDGDIWSTDEDKIQAVYNLTTSSYKAKPLKRTYIEKNGKKEKRPLGIPTMTDRAMQDQRYTGISHSLYGIPVTPSDRALQPDAYR